MSLSSNLLPITTLISPNQYKKPYIDGKMNDDLVLFEIFFFWAMNPVTFFFLPFSTSVRNVSLNLNVERSFSWKRMQNPSQGTHKIALWGKYTS